MRKERYVIEDLFGNRVPEWVFDIHVVKQLCESGWFKRVLVDTNADRQHGCRFWRVRRETKSIRQGQD